MSLRENPASFFPIKITAGGTDYVPPAFCLRPAHTSAYAAAHVGATRSPECVRRVLRRVSGQAG
jgi:hypothetical protein